MYDDLRAAPRVVDVLPQEVGEFIEAIAQKVYELSHAQGGTLPYTIIREIAENFIHAGFSECTVSVLDSGDTLRFADQGPGITKKELVLKPGVSSATSSMKEYIRGVGSGFPLVREYLNTVQGSLTLEDNAANGVVITLSLVGETSSLEGERSTDEAFGSPAPPASLYPEATSGFYSLPPLPQQQPFPQALQMSQMSQAQQAFQVSQMSQLPQPFQAAPVPQVSSPAPLSPLVPQGSHLAPLQGSHLAPLSPLMPLQTTPQGSLPAQGMAQGAMPPFPSPFPSSLPSSPPSSFAPRLSEREEKALLLLYEQGMLGGSELAGPLGVSKPTVTRLLQKLEDLGMVESTSIKKRILSNAGVAYTQRLLEQK